MKPQLTQGKSRIVIETAKGRDTRSICEMDARQIGNSSRADYIVSAIRGGLCLRENFVVSFVFPVGDGYHPGNHKYSNYSEAHRFKIKFA